MLLQFKLCCASFTIKSVNLNTGPTFWIIIREKMKTIIMKYIYVFWWSETQLWNCCFHLVVNSSQTPPNSPKIELITWTRCPEREIQWKCFIVIAETLSWSWVTDVTWTRTPEELAGLDLKLSHVLELLWRTLWRRRRDGGRFCPADTETESWKQSRGEKFRILKGTKDSGRK